MALPGQLVINFIIKNTFITIEPGAQEETEYAGVCVRRCKSAPPRMRSIVVCTSRGAAVEGAMDPDGCVISRSHDGDGGGVAEASSDDEGSVVAYFSEYTSMRDHAPEGKKKAKPSVLRRQQMRDEDLFLEEAIARVKAEQWDVLSRQLIELYTQKYSLSTLRLEMLAPQRRQVIHKLAFMHCAVYTGISPEEIHAMTCERTLRHTGENIEIWVSKRDAQKRVLRLLLHAAARFQKLYEANSVMVMNSSLRCHLEIPCNSVAMMPLKQFKSFMAGLFGAKLSTVDIYSLGHKLKGEKIGLAKHYVVPGSLLQMCTRAAVPSENL